MGNNTGSSSATRSPSIPTYLDSQSLSKKYDSNAPLSTPGDCTPFKESGKQKEGYEGRRMKLYHVTDQNATALILADNRFIRGSYGYFGAGIYFAESPDDAHRKARVKGGVVLSSIVTVGISLIIDDGNHGSLKYDEVQKLKCDSVKGTHLNGNEWIVFNNAQARSIRVESGMTPIDCDDQECARFGKKHYGLCGKVCENSRCLMYRKKHRAHCKTKHSKKIVWSASNE